MPRKRKGGTINKYIENYVDELNKTNPSKKELEKYKKLYLNAYARHMGVARKTGKVLKKDNKLILQSFDKRVENEKQRRWDVEERKKREQEKIVARNLRKAEVEDARKTLVHKKLGLEKERQQQQDTLNIRELQGRYLGATGSAVIPEDRMPETSASRYLKRKKATKKRGLSKLRGGKYKTKKHRTRKKMKTKKRRKQRKRKTRKRRGGKKINMFRLNMDIDGDLGFAKESLTPQSKHPGDLSLQFFSSPTRLQKRLKSYPDSPPVIKGIFGTNSKKTAEAQTLYQKGLHSQKASLEFILNNAFEEEKYIKKSGEQLPPEYMIGNPVTTDAVLNALDEPYRRLGLQNNMRTKVNQWRQMNTK